MDASIIIQFKENQMFILETERLKLIPLTHELLKICQHNRPEMEELLGLNISQMQIAPEYVAELLDALEHFWLPHTAANPDNYQWYTNWEIVLKQDNLAIGGIGFAGYVDDNGAVETGFMLDEKFHKQGFASEALQAMIAWAFTDDKVVAVIARTHEHNRPTQQLLARAGFSVDGVSEGLITYRRERNPDIHR